MPYDSMSAWGLFEFSDTIQSRGQPWNGTMSFDSPKGRQISRDDYTPPSPPATSDNAPTFTAAKLNWSPPSSPRTRSLRYDSASRQNSLTRRSPPRVDSPKSIELPSTPKTPEERHSDHDLADNLYAAACAGDNHHINLLLELGAPINTPTLVPNLYDAFKPAKAGPLSALAGAAGNGQLKTVKLLLANGASLNPTMKESTSSPLHQACKNDDVEMVTYLLSCGADVNLLNCFNTSCTMYAGKYGSPELLQIILSYNPDLHRLSFINSAAIHWTLWTGKAKNVQLLLEAGADPNHALGDESTPLHLAARSDLSEIARVLLAYGADCRRKNDEGLMPVELATGETKKVLRAAMRKEKK